MPDITLKQAHALIDAALAEANEIGVLTNVAIVDAGNNLKAFARQDRAWLGSIDIALNKAYTARAFDIQTRELNDQVQPGGALYGLAAGNDGRLITFAGGIPIVADGKIIGAIGVSGGTVEQDQQIAEAGIAGGSGQTS